MVLGLRLRDGPPPMIHRTPEFELLDQTSLKAFWAASETLNFTRAAERAAMTQPGISQHVARLERTLGTPLFSRARGQMKLTAAGVALQRYIRHTHEQYEALVDGIRADLDHVRGLVQYAMPMSCLLSPHFARLLAHRARQLADVELQVRVCDDASVAAAVLDDAVHFGFVTEPSEAPALHHAEFCDEEYVLVGRGAVTLAALEDLVALPFIAYPGLGAALRRWAAVQFPRRRVAIGALRIGVEIDQLYGVLTALEEGAGYTVIARHCVDRLLAERRVDELRHRAARATNAIQIVTRAGRSLPRRTRAVIEAFHEIACAKRNA